MINIYFGLIITKNKKTNKIKREITKITDSPYLAAYFLDERIKKIKSNKNLLIDYKNLEEELISYEFIEDFEEKIPYNISFVEITEEYKENFKVSMLESGLNESEIEELTDFENEGYYDVEFLEDLQFYKDQDESFINSVIEDFLSDKENKKIDFIGFCNSEDYLMEIETFKNSKRYSYYKDDISNIIEEYEEEEFEEESYDSIDSDSLVSLYSAQILNYTQGKWKEQLNFLKKLYERDDLFLSILHTNDSYGTFGNDNKQYLLSFIKQEIIDALENNTFDNKKFGFIMTIRQFTNIMHKPNIPVKRVSMCYINNDGIFPISKKDIIIANSTCAMTGKKIKKEEGVQYVGFEKMLDYLNIK